MNTPERSQAIGLVLISAILIAYFAFFAPEPVPQATPAPKSLVVKDEIKDLNAENDTSNSVISSDSLAKSEVFYTDFNNELLKLSISSKGAQIAQATLSQFKTYKKQDLILLKSERERTELAVELSNGKKLNLNDIHFKTKGVQTIASGANQIQFEANNGSGSIVKTFTIEPNSYLLQVAYTSSGSLLIRGEVKGQIDYLMPLTEKDMTVSRQTATLLMHSVNDKTVTLSETSTDKEEEKAEAKTQWFSFKQKFFTYAWLSPTAFDNVTLQMETQLQDSNTVKYQKAIFSIPTESGSFAYRNYIGPNNLSILKSVGQGFEDNLYLGWPVINIVNRYVIAPTYNFLEKMVTSGGLAIILLVLIIKLVLFPLSYKAYSSMAVMKVLKPELDAIKAKTGDDTAAAQQEQMKLYQQVGVNPLSGCVPVLLQMPILLAMFNFFPNIIELRQQTFLWADDLSTYDVIAQLPFAIPAYGSHVSLFTLLMTASTLVYTWYNNQVTTATGPMLTMSYIMPLVFMFVLNSMPAGLSFYYFVSNVVTVGQQYLIRSFVDDDKIRLKLENNKNTAHLRKPNRLQQRLQDAMKAQEDIKSSQKKTKK